MEREIVTAGFDLAKNVFQVHAIGSDGALLIRKQYSLSLGSYGRPRMTMELKEACLDVGERRVGRLMRLNGIKPVRTRKHKVTTDSHHRLGVAANWLDGDFAADGPNRKWAGGITYVWTHEGWLYLAVILDLHSRRVVGWAVSDRMKKDLVIRALDMAVRLRNPPKGCLFHSDRGSQYCSYDYQKKLQAHGLRPSMSGKGILQADAYGGYGELYREGRDPAPVLEAACFAHARRKFFELADVAGAARRKSRGQRSGMIYPIALEAVQRLDALFEIERALGGKAPAERLTVRQELSAPLMAELHTWLTTQLARLSRSHDLTKACRYMLKRWDAFTRFLDDGRICLTNNAAERALRCIPLGRKAWLFCGSDRGGQRAASRYRLHPMPPDHGAR